MFATSLDERGMEFATGTDIVGLLIPFSVQLPQYANNEIRERCRLSSISTESLRTTASPCIQVAMINVRINPGAPTDGGRYMYVVHTVTSLSSPTKIYTI
ncbi:hypothetical protein Trydic_g23885 [Trypoxylus dichotomus]